MTLLPRSLLWRTVLLLAILLVAGNLAWLQIFRVTEREPRAIQMAQQIASVVNLTRSALITANTEKRLDLLRDLSQQEGIQVHGGDPNETLTPLPDLPFAQLVNDELKRRLGPDTRFLGARDGATVWISFAIDDEEYWVRLPRDRLERARQLRWLGWGALVLLLSLAGAWLMVTRINRPLRQLARAAAEVGHGRMPAPVAESGATEIRTLSRAFNQMTDDLRRLDEDRALLLAGVSHDLRTPLSRIRLGIEMMDNGDSPLKEGMVKDIEDIDGVIGQFLDFARIGGEQPPAEEADLNELVLVVVERYARQPVRIVTRLATRLPRLPLRIAAMQRLLSNLIDNGLRHGGPDVDIVTQAGEHCVWLSVLDRGPGIPSSDTARMLQPFTRMDRARGTSGSGLGLAIVDRIARMHGGTISLVSRDGGGLEARLELPLKPPMPAMPSSGSAPDPHGGMPQTQ